MTRRSRRRWLTQSMLPETRWEIVARPEVEVEVKEAEGYKLHLANRSASTTGYKGVKEKNGRFEARRKVDGKKKFTSARMARR